MGFNVYYLLLNFQDTFVHPWFNIASYWQRNWRPLHWLHWLKTCLFLLLLVQWMRFKQSNSRFFFVVCSVSAELSIGQTRHNPVGGSSIIAQRCGCATSKKFFQFHPMSLCPTKAVDAVMMKIKVAIRIELGSSGAASWLMWQPVW
jgi:hypothetical protein